MHFKSFVLVLLFCEFATANSPFTCQCTACAAYGTDPIPPPTSGSDSEVEIVNIRQGKQGPKGEPGERGDSGTAPEIDYVRVEEMLWSKLLFIQNIKKVYPTAILTSNKRAYVVSSKTMVWNDAVSYCTALGAKIAGKELLKPEIRRELRTILPGKWIGLSDADTESVWLWLDAETTDEVLITMWASDEPNGGTNENCAHFYTSNTLNDNSCNRDLQVLCEIEV